MSNYATSLSSLTGGRASFIMKFASYELVPGDLQKKLIEAHEAEGWSVIGSQELFKNDSVI